MNFTYKTREFYPDELQLLKKLKAKQIKESKSRFKFYHFLIAGAMGILFTYLAINTKTEFLIFLFGTGAVFAYVFILFMPYEIYKQRNNKKDFYNLVDEFMKKGTVETTLIKAKRIAIAEEFEDEGDLFIVDYDNDQVLYLWDYEYNFKKGFPCLEFEIYEDKFSQAFGTQIYPKSDPIEPIVIDKKAKWNYMMTIGTPDHLSSENINFDKLVADYNTSA